jgi:hypothetical protein
VGAARGQATVARLLEMEGEAHVTSIARRASDGRLRAPARVRYGRVAPATSRRALNEHLTRGSRAGL